MMDIQHLKDVDVRNKPAGANNEWSLALLFYEDQGRQVTFTQLKGMGLGLSKNETPLEINLLKRIVDRIAVIYARPPTRWLVKPTGTRLSESSAAHKDMTRVLDRAQYNLALRMADRYRALMRQAVVRIYPSDARGSCVLRVFPPHHVVRDFDASSPDILDTDRSFALRLAGGDPKDERWEVWSQAEEGWFCRVVNLSGAPVGEQPYAEFGDVCPYEKLPVQLLYDDYPGGRAWLPPRASRGSFVACVNGMANDLWALVVHEAHTRGYVATDEQEAVPDEHGPGKLMTLPKDAVVGVLSTNPKLTESREILNGMVSLWSLSEELPTSEFDESKQVLTGASLRVLLRPLLARREAQVPLAQEDERQLYQRFRAVHNIHAGEWDLPLLDANTDVEVELAELDIPTSGRDLLEDGAKSAALGTKSVIDIIQSQYNVPRHKAVAIYERVRQDATDYPPGVDPTTIQTGPKMTDVSPDDGRTQAQTPDVAPSVLDAESMVGLALS